MEKLPENMIEEILLKLPANTLVNLRYESNDLWRLITDPSFIKLHLLRHSIAQLNNPNPSLLISSRHIVPFPLYRGDAVFGIGLKIHNYECNFPITISTSCCHRPEIHPEAAEMHLPFESTEIRASCNGLLYLHQRFASFIDGRWNLDTDISYYIWNPCTKEYKKLPPPPPPLLVKGVDVGNMQSRPKLQGRHFSSTSGFCGFGYDRNNDEYKILHYENYLHTNCIDYDGVSVQLQSISSILEFKLYTLGTDKWTLIADNPYRSFYFTVTTKPIGLLVNGALHWIMSLSDLSLKAGKIISFDIEKEVFRELQKPCYYYSSKQEEEEVEPFYSESLQILQECLCMCQVVFDEQVNKINIDIWMLQDYDLMDSWTKLFKVVVPEEEFNFFEFRLLRYCENGEIVMLRNHKDVIVYDPVIHKVRCAKKFNESMSKCWKYYTDYTESLVCLNSGTFTDRASS